MRTVDKKATKAARERHLRGELILQMFMQLPYELVRARRVGLPLHHSLQGAVIDSAPFRTNPKCPRPRTAAQRARHLDRKRRRAARKANR